MTVLALLCIALWGAVASEPDVPQQLAVVLYDHHRGITAGLELSDASAVSDLDFERPPGALLVRLRGRASAAEAASGPDLGSLLGHAQGGESAVARLTQTVRGWQRPAQSVGVLAAAEGLGVYEGSRCAECRTAVLARAAVATVGLRADVAEVVVPGLEAVQGDPVEVLLELAARAPEFWGDPEGPRSAMLVVIGSDAAVEAIAVDRHGAVGRRLVERHIRHLADVEVPHRIAAAKDAAKRGDVASFERHQRKALAAADQALESLPNERALNRLRAEAATL